MSLTNDSKTGLFWTPRGGNNAHDIWASCHTFTSISEDEKTKEKQTTTIIVDMGQHEVPKSFSTGRYDKVVPALDDCLNVPGEKTPGHEAQAIFLTHCHSDHIAGIYEYLQMGVRLPDVYASQYTLNALKKDLIEKNIDKKLWPNMVTLEAGSVVKIGDITVQAYPASHSIPGCFSFKISNKEASIFHSGDTKADETSFLDKGIDISSYQKIAKDENIDLMTFDATATHLKGHALYESEIFDAYKKLFTENQDRQIIAVLPAAHMERLASVVCAAQASGKNVIINGGTSMESNILALQLSGYDLQKKCPDIKIVSANTDEADKLDPEKCITITTGLYGEPASPFVNHLTGGNSKFTMTDDAVIIAPTSNDNNEKIHLLLNDERFSKLKVVTGKENPNIYGSGHAQADDFIKIANYIRPKTIAPIHCSSEKADQLNELAGKNGFKTLDSYPHNGSTVQINKDRCHIISKASPHWFGINHYLDNNNTMKTVFSKVEDGGYSTQGISLLKKRQEEAVKKILNYRSKKNASPAPFTLRRDYGR